jgi:alkylation response protein AidB-like acyl-CoA dehydrogenase
VDFEFSNEQQMLRESLAGYLRKNCAFELRRAGLAEGGRWHGRFWGGFADELGILGAAFSDSEGGLGGGPIENMVIMQELGAALVAESYLATVVVGGGLFKYSGQANSGEWMRRIIAGEAVLALAAAEPQSRFNLAAVCTTARKEGDSYVLSGHKAVVVGAPFASHLLVTARTAGGPRDQSGISVFVVPVAAQGLKTTSFTMVDGWPASEVRLEGVRVDADALIGTEGEAWNLLTRVIDEAVAATCAEACGVLTVLHESTLSYTRTRKQFGAPLAANQVLQHRLVDMFIEVEQSLSMTYMATMRVADEAERAKAVSAAKVQIGQACRFVGQNAVQLHGGMGMTDETPVAHYFKRATLLESRFGSTDHHFARYAALSFR